MNNAVHTFRVRPRAQPREHTSGTSDGSAAASFHHRRPHTKSRLGCETCKQRRKKCDEQRPTCSLCAKKNLPCTYYDTALQRKRNALNLHTSSLLPSLWPGPHAPAVLTTHPSDATHTKYDLYLIQHFVESAAPHFEAPDHGGIYSVNALDLAKECPFVMHAMIAVAACHLQHLPIDARQYRVPEAFHCQLASRGLRNAVASINGVKEADSVLTTAMLLNCLTFCAADWREADVNGSEQGWEWLRIQIGITDLLIRTRPFHPESIWLPMFMASKTFRIVEPPQNDLDARLAAFCGIDVESDTAEGNKYFDFFQGLAPIVTRPADVKYFNAYINAVGGISYEFIGLLEARDTRALLLFAHWAALMCAVRSWWNERRTSRACWAVCSILQGRLKGRDLELLEQPAKACGFLLQLRERKG
ncbi:hypothetical protein BU26DRAFT_524204 [Trematosphaeria pertusa]|uniref:Zn(2)-C6 fungal-type domain-containing protein n=1 Tax=Trematosphaeria pertusa TaxID=390896 RepID=A0A6A6HWL7_9PLEO|nr:uncharacterized protein BU26DRAFT_524204 [Trematosphaeria pertusa]KAF2242604.1 hypothetical protein BU26DRAFT_524204 [Trematosphaeria pertusa]